MCAPFGIPSPNVVKHLTVFDFVPIIYCLTPALRRGVVSAPLRRREPPIIRRGGVFDCNEGEGDEGGEGAGGQGGMGLGGLDDAVRVTLEMTGLWWSGCLYVLVQRTGDMGGAIWEGLVLFVGLRGASLVGWAWPQPYPDG